MDADTGKERQVCGEFSPLIRSWYLGERTGYVGERNLFDGTGHGQTYYSYRQGASNNECRRHFFIIILNKENVMDRAERHRPARLGDVHGKDDVVRALRSFKTMAATPH